MITNRSNHMPRLINSERIKSQVVFRRSFCENSDSGSTQLQINMIHAAHHHSPKTRFQKYCVSTGLPPTHAMKNSLRYAHPTTIDVNKQSLAPASRSFSVT